MQPGAEAAQPSEPGADPAAGCGASAVEERQLWPSKERRQWPSMEERVATRTTGVLRARSAWRKSSGVAVSCSACLQRPLFRASARANLRTPATPVTTKAATPARTRKRSQLRFARYSESRCMCRTRLLKNSVSAACSRGVHASHACMYDTCMDAAPAQAPNCFGGLRLTEVRQQRRRLARRCLGSAVVAAGPGLCTGAPQ